MIKRKLKILHLPTSVGGNSWGLAQAERRLGLDSIVLIAENNWLNYPYDICLSDVSKNNLIKFLRRIKAFFNIRDKFDIFHFNFGSTLISIPKYRINLVDLPFYKGKKIMTFNGCDARQKYPTIKRTSFSACHETNCWGGICNSGKMDMIKKRLIKKASKYVDHMFALNPDLMYFLPAEKTTFLPYTIAGWYDIKYTPYKIKHTINIIHAPTDKGAKGSKYILKALEILQKRYRNIKIEFVQNVPYKNALKKYEKAHIIVDQVLVGWYGGLAVEAMKMGKPVAVFIREEDLKFIPKDMAMDLKEAIININPFNIVEVLSEYIENPKLLIFKSQAGLNYVNKWHDPIKIAQITKSIYEKILYS